jgi:hypothetical protein
MERYMDGLRKPERKARGKFSSFLYLDADQTVESLSALEGGLIEELRSVSEEESTGGKGLSGSVGYGGTKIGGSLSKDQRLRSEEEDLRKRTGISRVTTLLDKLREAAALGAIERYGPEVYEAIEEGELYEFKAEVRLHPFHQFVAMVQGADEFSKDWELDDADLNEMRRQVDNAFYGKNRDRTTIVVFADLDGAGVEYKVALPIKEQHLLVDLEDFSGTATFVAQVWRKIADGQKIPAARLVRKMPFVSPFEEQMMVSMIPALQDEKGMGIDGDEEDILLRKPAIVMKPLCVYRG